MTPRCRAWLGRIAWAAGLALAAVPGTGCEGDRASVQCPSPCGPHAAAAGAVHTCALFRSAASGEEETFGQVACWGDNRHGQLGSPTGIGVSFDPVPAAVPGLEDARSVAADSWHTCATDAHGKAFCWGDNSQGQLGDGSTDGSFGPVEVRLDAVRATSVSAGGSGRGLAFSCALDGDGQVWCWGSNQYQLIGPGSLGEVVSLPQAVTGAGGMLQVAAGEGQACAVNRAGQTRCWGKGYGTATRPTEIECFLDAAGSAFCKCTVQPDGQVLCSGEPQPMDPLHKVAMVQVSVSGAGACGVEEGGNVLCWDAPGDQATKVSLHPAAKVSVGRRHACALHVDGSVSCWGDNTYGQLGLGHSDPVPEGEAPTRVQGLPWGVTDIAAGDHHTCATAEGAAFCWGSNTRTQLGRRQTSVSTTPYQVRFGDD